MTQEERVTTILHVMKDVEKSSLSVNEYFKDQTPPFGRGQYYAYKKTLREWGIAGLYDHRSSGNHLKFTQEMKHFVKGLLEYQRSMSALEVQNALHHAFGVLISQAVINAFRRETDLGWIRLRACPQEDESCSEESGASEIVVALALSSGLIDTLVNAITQCIQMRRESAAFRASVCMPTDHPDVRSNGRFTSAYNALPQVQGARFKPLDEKLTTKRLASLRILHLSKATIRRYTLALFSLPLVTTNGRVSRVDAPKGNALQYLCGVNYKAATLDKHVRELKYLQVSEQVIEATARFWIGFWSSRTPSENLFACYYLDGNTKALWSSKPCHKGKVTMLGRVMNCLEQVFIHDSQGHPLYFQTFNGHAALGKHALKMIETISGYLTQAPHHAPQVTVNRILIMDGGGNGVKTLRELSHSGYYFITMLDTNRFTERKVKFLSGATRYEYGEAFVVECTIELEDSKEKGYLFETRAVQVHWDTTRTSVLITNVPTTLFSTDSVVKSYFDRWPAQELSFKDMKNGLNIHRVVGYGKKLVDNPTVLADIERLQAHIHKLEQELHAPLKDIQELEKQCLFHIDEERRYREKSRIVNGKRTLSAHDAQMLQGIQQEIHRLQRTIKTREQKHDKSFNALKKKKTELARIIDKKKRYRVDMELDQIMTCFKLSFANICCYLLDECFHGERMTLQRLFDTIFELRG
ncbi:MAG: hypothetical protein GY801_39020, partial [bacterium]|nr:hypothetical protein [bacterium]